MPACEMKPADKKAYVGAVGEELVRRHGKRKYYEPRQVVEASSARGYGVDYVCWAHCIYISPGDFKALHEAAGEACDHVAMKAEVLGDLAGGSFQWLDVDLSWLEWPDIDLSGVFDWFDLSP